MRELSRRVASLAWPPEDAVRERRPEDAALALTGARVVTEDAINRPAAEAASQRNRRDSLLFGTWATAKGVGTGDSISGGPFG